MNDYGIDDHSLYLLVDGQLDTTSQRRLMEKINASPELKRKLADVSKVKELISLAYTQETSRPAPVKDRSSNIFPSLFVAMAASLIMGFGVTLGWITHQHYDSLDPVIVTTINPAVNSRPAIPVDASTQNIRKFIIHVNFLDESQLESAIVETSSILHSYASVGLPVQMELAFNLQAVRIFEPQHISQAQKVKKLIDGYENLKLYACSESLDKILGDFKKPEVMSVFHTDRIVREMIDERINQGWIYIKV
jgi:intracellular sulfur oxidation DsrE/DsrF family protein